MLKNGCTAISCVIMVGSVLLVEDLDTACCLAVRPSYMSFLMCFGCSVNSLIILDSGAGKQGEDFLRLPYLNLILQLCLALGLLTPSLAISKLPACLPVGFYIL